MKLPPQLQKPRPKVTFSTGTDPREAMRVHEDGTISIPTPTLRETITDALNIYPLYYSGVDQYAKEITPRSLIVTKISQLTYETSEHTLFRFHLMTPTHLGPFTETTMWSGVRIGNDTHHCIVPFDKQIEVVKGQCVLQARFNLKLPIIWQYE